MERNCYFIKVLLIFLPFCSGWASEWREQFDSLYRVAEETRYMGVTEAGNTVDSLYTVAHRSGDMSLTMRALYQDVAVRYANDNQDYNRTDTILSLMQSCDTLAFPFEQGLLYFALLETNCLSGDYIEAYRYGLRALEIFRDTGHPVQEAEVNNVIGSLFKKLREYEVSIDYIRKAAGYFKTAGDRKNAVRCRLNLYTSVFLSGRFGEATSKLEAELPEIRSLDDPYLLAMAYFNLGAYYVQGKQRKNAYRYYMAVKELAGRIDNPNLRVSLEHNLGTFYLRENQPDSSYRYLNAVTRYYEKTGRKGRLMPAYISLSRHFYQNRQYDSAYYYFCRYDSVRDLLIGNRQLSLLHREQARNILSVYQDKLKLAESELLLRKKQSLIIILSAAGLVLIAISGFFILTGQKKIIRQREALKELENKKLNEKLAHEEKILRLEKEKYNEKIASADREISSSLLLLSSKNTILNHILELTGQCDSGEKPFPEYRRQVEAVIGNSLRLDDEWHYFKLHFDKVHPGFFARLLELSDSLTENDLRLCAYIKIGMRIKQIAQMLAVTPESVKTSRYRLKKKFSFDEGLSIDEFIRNISRETGIEKSVCFDGPVEPVKSDFYSQEYSRAGE